MSSAEAVTDLEMPRARRTAADATGDSGAFCSGQLADGSVVVAGLVDTGSMRVASLPAAGAPNTSASSAGGAPAAVAAVCAAPGGTLLALQTYKDGLLAVLSDPGGGGGGGRELGFFRLADLLGSSGGGTAPGPSASISLGDVEAVDTVPLPGAAAELDCVALSEQRGLGAVFGRKRVLLYDLAGVA